MIRTPRSTAQIKQQKTFRNPTIEIISDLNSNCQLPKPGDRINFNTLKISRINDERPTGNKNAIIEWDDGGKISNNNKLILTFKS